jgi:hypothetical protein
MMRAALVFAGLLAGASAALAQQPVTGRYQAVGTNFDGSQYRSFVEILQASDVTCRIRWVDAQGRSGQDGICMRSGPIVTAAYILNGKPGLIIYRQMENGVLDGQWTVSGASGVGKEVLSPLR